MPKEVKPIFQKVATLGPVKMEFVTLANPESRDFFMSQLAEPMGAIVSLFDRQEEAFAISVVMPFCQIQGKKISVFNTLFQAPMRDLSVVVWGM